MLKKKKSGFTLVEMIIALSLTVVVLGLIYNIFTTGNKVFSDSDVKSTLQMEAKDIQEKISDIGMQAVGIQLLNGDSDTNEISNMVINSYYKNGNQHDFKIEKKDSRKTYKNGEKIYEIYIDNKSISKNVQSLKINNNDNIINAAESRLQNINSIEFNIVLRKEKGFTDVTYPINFTVTFRNNSK